MSSGIVLFAHGSRDPGWSAPFERLATRVRAQRPDAHVAIAYLELMAPALEEAVGALIAHGANELAVVPVFLAPGGHVRRDLPRRVQQLQALHPTVRFRVLPTIGESERVLDAIAAWVAAETR